MPRASRWGWFWGTPIADISGRKFRFYGLTLGDFGFGVMRLDRQP